jgi:hypothetical protein
LFANAHARLKATSDYPNNRTFMWSEKAQGVAHDNNNWFFSQAEYLWKIPVTVDLNQHYSDSYKSLGIIKISIPKKLREKGYSHLGDIDHFNGRIYVPLEGQYPLKLLIYRAADLKLLGVADFPQWQDSAPWVAIHPKTGEIFTSDFNPKDTIGLYRYKIHWKKGIPKLHLSGTFQLRHPVTDRPIAVRRMQGGAFDPLNNLLMLASDSSSGGLYAFDADEGKLKFQQFVNFSPGFPYYEEIEGLDVWHFPPGGQVRGSVHLLLLDNDVGPDDIYFKHFTFER